MSVLELSYIKVIQGIYTSILKQIWLPFELRVLKKVSWSKLHGTKSCTFSTGSVTVVIKVIYLHNTQTNVVHRDQEYNWKPPTKISRKQRFKKKGMIMLIKTVIKRCQDFRPPEFFYHWQKLKCVWRTSIAEISSWEEAFLLSSFNP